MTDKKLQKEINKRAKNIKQLLAQIEKQVESYQDVEFPHWGHAGDLGHIEQQLEEIKRFAK